jgi:hypothetical protein
LNPGVLLVFPQVRTHFQYQEFVVNQLCLHYPRGFLPFITKDLPLLLKFWLTDLSGTAALLQHTFHAKGPLPHDPANLLRSYLLMLQMKEISVTRWVTELHRCGRAMQQTGKSELYARSR